MKIVTWSVPHPLCCRPVSPGWGEAEHSSSPPEPIHNVEKRTFLILPSTTLPGSVVVMVKPNQNGDFYSDVSLFGKQRRKLFKAETLNLSWCKDPRKQPPHSFDPWYLTPYTLGIGIFSSWTRVNIAFVSVKIYFNGWREKKKKERKWRFIIFAVVEDV